MSERDERDSRPHYSPNPNQSSSSATQYIPYLVAAFAIGATALVWYQSKSKTKDLKDEIAKQTIEIDKRDKILEYQHNRMTRIENLLQQMNQQPLVGFDLPQQFQSPQSFYSPQSPHSPQQFQQPQHMFHQQQFQHPQHPQTQFVPNQQFAYSQPTHFNYPMGGKPTQPTQPIQPMQSTQQPYSHQPRFSHPQPDHSNQHLRTSPNPQLNPHPTPQYQPPEQPQPDTDSQPDVDNADVDKMLEAELLGVQPDHELTCDVDGVCQLPSSDDDKKKDL